MYRVVSDEAVLRHTVANYVDLYYVGIMLHHATFTFKSHVAALYCTMPFLVIYSSSYRVIAYCNSSYCVMQTMFCKY